jgi:hypothetical protein
MSTPDSPALFGPGPWPTGSGRRRIWKFPLRDRNDLPDGSVVFDISMPVGSIIFSAAFDPDGEPCVWAAVPTDTPRRGTRRILVAPTGGNFPQRGRFLETWVKAELGLVGHVFEMIQVDEPSKSG